MICFRIAALFTMCVASHSSLLYMKLKPHCRLISILYFTDSRSGIHALALNPGHPSNIHPRQTDWICRFTDQRLNLVADTYYPPLS